MQMQIDLLQSRLEEKSQECESLKNNNDLLAFTEPHVEKVVDEKAKKELDLTKSQLSAEQNR